MRRIGQASVRSWRGLFLTSAVALSATQAAAQQKPGEPGKTEESRPAQYCAGIANAAADARFAWQKEALTALSKDIENRISQLEAKRAEYEEWLKRRQAFLAKADESVTAIYARMRPEAAAQQLTAMDSEAAAAILTRLDARIASAILNEMEPGRLASSGQCHPRPPLGGRNRTHRRPNGPRGGARRAASGAGRGILGSQPDRGFE
uniref:MotE family protein n=1 Tax=Methylobacterium sp. 092160098-2 TaxID=3025129 RepID=UPI003159578B